MKMMSYLEKFLLPIGDALSRNKPLTIVRKAMIGVVPLTIAGSIALIIQYFPFIDKVVPASVMKEISGFLGVMTNATLGLVALFVAAFIGYYYAQDHENDGIFGAIVAMSCFIIVTPFVNAEGIGTVLSTKWLGAQGLFVALFVGLGSGFIFNSLINRKITIKLPDSVPPMVSAPFTILVPALVSFVAFAGLRYVFTFTSYGDIHNAVFGLIQRPLLSLGTTLAASIVVVVVIQLLWFVGLHGQIIVLTVMTPIWATATLANMDAVTKGGTAIHIFTAEFFSGFIWMQFISLIIACLLVAKSAQLKSVSRVAIGSGIFNISEPIVFGAPVVTNVMLLIPWVLVMVVYVIITWLFMKTGITPLPTGAAIPWTTPPILSGYLITGSIMGAVLQLVNIVVGTVIYLPFVKIYDKQLQKEEQQAIA